MYIYIRSLGMQYVHMYIYIPIIYCIYIHCWASWRCAKSKCAFHSHYCSGMGKQPQTCMQVCQGQIIKCRRECRGMQLEVNVHKMMVLHVHGRLSLKNLSILSSNHCHAVSQSTTFSHNHCPITQVAFTIRFPSAGLSKHDWYKFAAIRLFSSTHLVSTEDYLPDCFIYIVSTSCVLSKRISNTTHAITAMTLGCHAAMQQPQKA